MMRRRSDQLSIFSTDRSRWAATRQLTGFLFAHPESRCTSKPAEEMKPGTNMSVAAAQRDHFQIVIPYQPLDGACATAGDVCLAELAATTLRRPQGSVVSPLECSPLASSSWAGMRPRSARMTAADPGTRA